MLAKCGLVDAVVDAKVNQEVNRNFMKATVSVICYRHKVLANGESPLMVRIAKDGRRTMK